MRRAIRRPDLICVADWHLRDTVPRCRTDDFLWAQRVKLIWLEALRAKYGCRIVSAGDVFQVWKSSPFIINQVLRYFPKDVVSVAGQHDLPGHNFNRVDESAYWSLVCSDKMTDISDGEIYEDDFFDIWGFPWNAPLKKVDKTDRIKVALMHKMVYKGRKPFPEATGGVQAIMKKLEGFDLIVSGDNHLPFTFKNAEGQLLINCGSVTRQDADQAKFRPRVYLWYADTNTAEPVYFPIVDGVVSRAHIEEPKKREERINSFVEKLQSGTVDTMDAFEVNLDKYNAKNHIKKRVISKIKEAMP